MNADLNPIKIALVFFVEFVFGIGYNAAVAYAHDHKLMHVSLSVVVGVAVTLLISTAAWFSEQMPFWAAGMLIAGCFTASGLPMIFGSMRRTTAERDQKKRRALGNTAMRIRDEAAMDLHALAAEIAERSKKKDLNASDLPDYVNRLHGVIGALRSL